MDSDYLEYLTAKYVGDYVSLTGSGSGPYFWVLSSTHHLLFKLPTVWNKLEAAAFLVFLKEVPERYVSIRQEADGSRKYDNLLIQLLTEFRLRKAAGITVGTAGIGLTENYRAHDALPDTSPSVDLWKVQLLKLWGSIKANREPLLKGLLYAVIAYAAAVVGWGIFS